MAIERTQQPELPIQTGNAPELSAPTAPMTPIESTVQSIAELPSRKPGRMADARVRIPVTGTVQITPLEAAIIDTRAFQRLRKIRQLGSTYVVYPGANHSRFEHCLGVLQMSENICAAIERNDSQSIDAKDRKLIRLAALLHDIGHLAFGHTLEDEVQLFPKHDSDARVGELLESGEIKEVFVRYNQEDALKEVVAILRKDAVKKLPKSKAFRADIVANTVCADLLDYLRRDFYHLGIEYNFDDRIFEYMTLATDSEGRTRFAIALLKTNKFRHDATTQIIELLNLRYMLAECALFHHAKDSHSAMLSRALLESDFLLSLACATRDEKTSEALKARYEEDQHVASYFEKPFGIAPGELLYLGDDELIARLAKDANPITATLARMLESRQLYRTCAEIDYATASHANAQSQIVQELHDEPATRFRLERTLEQELSLPRGSVLLYCPSKEMNLKVAGVHILAAVVAVPLSVYEVEHGRKLTSGFLDAQLERFRRLWRMYVFVHPAVPARAAERASQYVRARYFLNSAGKAHPQREKQRDRDYRRLAAEIYAERHPTTPVGQFDRLLDESLYSIESRAQVDDRPIRSYLEAFELGSR